METLAGLAEACKGHEAFLDPPAPRLISAAPSPGADLRPAGAKRSHQDAPMRRGLCSPGRRLLATFAPRPRRRRGRDLGRVAPSNSAKTKQKSEPAVKSMRTKGARRHRKAARATALCRWELRAAHPRTRPPSLARCAPRSSQETARQPRPTVYSRFFTRVLFWHNIRRRRDFFGALGAVQRASPHASKPAGYHYHIRNLCCSGNQSNTILQALRWRAQVIAHSQ
ncbi:hypothetical protein DFH11DRAFT_1623425 [Phellopilus nigrolimitatus]|nr:hypothetical protein DFH11DRAFT_1623425 [Phellopilus nigrolimitatus]